MTGRLAFTLVCTALIGCTPRAGSNPSLSEHPVSVTVPNTPILSLKDINPIAYIQVNAVDFNEVSIVLESTEGLSDLDEIILMAEGRTLSSKVIHSKRRKAKLTLHSNNLSPDQANSPSPESQTAGKADSRQINFSLALKTKPHPTLSNKITIKSISVKTNEGKMMCANPQWPQLRLGVALRQRGQDGVDNCRIPGLAITKKGTLLAIYDARREKDSDLQGDIDICYNRSTDGGRSWSDMKIAMDMGEWGGLPQKYNGVSDPCILVDENTGDIYISACWMYGVIDEKTGRWVEGLTSESKDWNHQWRKNGSLPGYDVRQSSQWIMTKSSDDGLSWSEPQNFTREVKPECSRLLINAPGAGITLADGTAVFPAQGKREDETHFSTIIFSRDGGKSWHSGTPAVKDHSVHSNECMAVQLSDGSIMLNMRSSKNRGNQERNGRLVYVTKDLGQTWEEHPTSGHVLTEPTCQGSLLKHVYRDKSGKERELLLFFNPNDTDKRRHHTMKCSLDEGLTWPENLWLELDEGLGNGYSCMVSLNNDTIGVIYEGSGACLVYQQVELKDILDKRAVLSEKSE